MSDGLINKSLFSKLLQGLNSLHLHKHRSELRSETSESKDALSERVEKSIDTESIQNQIIEAIRLKHKVELNYKGEGLRIVCPHALYISTSGRIRVDSYQVSGYSSHSNKCPYWRPFDIAKITGLKILNETFVTAPGYDPLSHKYSNAIFKI
jgi:predicted DNA-binding transcriptional regulator YafY